MIPIVTNEIPYAAYAGHCLPRSVPRCRVRAGGTAMFSTRSVIATAITPSEKDSSLAVFTPRNSPDSRYLLVAPTRWREATLRDDAGLAPAAWSAGRRAAPAR